MISTQQSASEVFESGSQVLSQLSVPQPVHSSETTDAPTTEATVVSLPAGAPCSRLTSLLDSTELPLISEVRTPLNHQNFSLLYDTLVPRLASLAASALGAIEFGINMGLIELLENCKDYHEPKDGSAEIGVSWKLEGESPFICVANSGSTVFNPARYLNRSGDDVYEEAQDLNCHMGIQMAANFGEKLSYRWTIDQNATVHLNLIPDREKDIVVCEPSPEHPEIMPRIGMRSRWLEVTMHLAAPSEVIA